MLLAKFSRVRGAPWWLVEWSFGGTLDLCIVNLLERVVRVTPMYELLKCRCKSLMV